MAQLYLNMIVSESEPIEYVDRAIDSVYKYVDGVYLTITHPTKDFPKKSKLEDNLVKKYKAHISHFVWTESFAEARQFALDKVPQGDDKYILWIDADDVVSGAENIPTILKEMADTKTDAAFFEYLYKVDLDQDGNIKEIVIKHVRERIVINNGTYSWKGNLHELLIEDKKENLRRYKRDDLVVIHLNQHKDLDEIDERNIRILEKTLVQEKGKDPRTRFYLARGYIDMAKRFKDNEEVMNSWFNMATKLLELYLNGRGREGDDDYLVPSGWPEERSIGWMHLGEIAMIQGLVPVAIEAFEEAIKECPYFPMYYLNLSRCYVLQQDFKKAEHYLNLAVSMPEPKTTVIQTPKDVKLNALEISYHINMHKMKLEYAQQDLENIIKINSEDDICNKRLAKVKDLIKTNKVAQSIVYISKFLEANKQKDRIPYLLKSMPKEIENERFALEMRRRFLPAKKWGDDEITIMCGPGFEEWTPDSIETGLGGSEEAVVYLSQELKKLGWKVTVYANPGDKAGDFNGVTYRPYYEMNVKDEFNILILWRYIGYMDSNPKAKFTLFWMHDIPNNPDMTKERIDKIDKIAVLSEAHKSLLRMEDDGKFIPVPDNKVFLTSNGIPNLNKYKWDGNPHRLIYSSSLDRGLIYLLNHWKEVRKEVKDAELHIYYGMEIFDTMHKNNPAMMKWKENILASMKQPGVFYHGRVGHDELHKEMCKSGIWAYPTAFFEISCITAMKCQSLGAIPVVTDFGALSETVKNGVKVDVDITEEEGQKEYIKTLIEKMKDVKWQEETRDNMIKFSRDYFKWSTVAQYWNELFKGGVQK